MIIELPDGFPAQVEIGKCKKRFVVAACGRRFGKGVFGICKGFEVALKSFRHVWWVCPSFASAAFSAGWEFSHNIASQIPGCVTSIQEHKFTFPNGGWFQFKTAEEPDGLRGEGLDLIVVDEAAHLKKLQPIWELCLRGALSDRKGRALFISTPNGFNFFNTLYRLAETDKDWASFHFTSKDRPSFDNAEYESAKASLPSLVFRQEYDAEFVQLAGALFRREMFRIVDEPPPTKTDVRSWDLAWTTKTMSDYTVGCRAGLTADGVLVIKHLVRGRWEWPQAMRIVAETARSDGPGCRQAIESVGAQAGFEQTLRSDATLANLSITAQPVTKDKITRAMPLLARAEHGQLVLKRGPWNQDLIDEFCSFPEGEHDDQVDATSAALEMIATRQHVTATLI